MRRTKRKNLQERGLVSQRFDGWGYWLVSLESDHPGREIRPLSAGSTSRFVDRTPRAWPTLGLAHDDRGRNQDGLGARVCGRQYDHNLGSVRYDKKGKPQLVKQTYDNATKVVADCNKQLMGMVAGSANLGHTSITDFLSRERAPVVQLDEAWLFELIHRMADERNAFWPQTQVPPERWPDSTILLGTPTPDGMAPRAWRIEIEGPHISCAEILQSPGIRLEGSYREAFSLIYGYDPEMLVDLRKRLKVKELRFSAGMRSLKVLRPVEKINLAVMPTQDAIDLAVFLAEVQVQMDRFLPGEPACGGPIDVLVLQTAPTPAIIPFPGKVMRHPRSQLERRP